MYTRYYNQIYNSNNQVYYLYSWYSLLNTYFLIFWGPISPICYYYIFEE